MKPFTWFADHRNYYDHPDEKAEREERLAYVNERLPKLMSGDFEGYDLDSLMHELAYLRMEKELFEAGQMIMDHWPWENKEFFVGELAYQYFGIFCYLVKRYGEAEQWFLKIIGAYDEGFDTTYFSWLACIYAETGHHEKATAYIEAINKHIMASKEPLYYHSYDFGKYFYSIGLYGEALVEFNRYQSDKTILESQFYIHKSTCLRLLQRFDEGREFLEAGYKIWHKDVEIQVQLAGMVLEDLEDYERALELFLQSFENTREYIDENWRDWNFSVCSNISKLYAQKSDWDNAYAYLRESLHWSDELMNKQMVLSMIDNRPIGDEVENPAMVFVSICDFIESAFAALPSHADTTEENPYLLDTNNEETLMNLTDMDTLSPN